MPITYNATTNVITVYDYPSATPATAEAIYQADLAGAWGKVTKLTTNNAYRFTATLDIGNAVTTNALPTYFVFDSGLLVFDNVVLRHQHNGFATYGKRSANSWAFAAVTIIISGSYGNDAYQFAFRPIFCNGCNVTMSGTTIIDAHSSTVASALFEVANGAIVNFKEVKIENNSGTDSFAHVFGNNMTINGLILYKITSFLIFSNFVSALDIRNIEANTGIGGRNVLISISNYFAANNAVTYFRKGSSNQSLVLIDPILPTTSLALIGGTSLGTILLRRTINVSVFNTNAVAIQSAFVALYNKNNNQEFLVQTANDGKIASQQALQAFSADNTTSFVDYNNFILRIRRYGNEFLEQVLAITDRINYNAYLKADTAVTLTLANAMLVTGVTVNFTNNTITFSGVSVKNAYDYVRYLFTQNMNVIEDFTTDGTGNYVFSYLTPIFNGVNALTGIGKIISTATAQYTNNGSTTLTVQDATGTKTSITLTGLIIGSEIRIYRISDESEFAGVESCPSALQTFNYTHTVDLSVNIVIFKEDYIPIRLTNILLTNVSQSIQIQQRRDRVYNNS